MIDMTDVSKLAKKLLQDPEFAMEYSIPNAGELRIIRKMRHLTQLQLAKRIGTKQSSISSLELNDESTTLEFIGKVAHALGYKARLVFTKLY